jgi:hypothetical protein
MKFSSLNTFFSSICVLIVFFSSVGNFENSRLHLFSTFAMKNTQIQNNTNQVDEDRLPPEDWQNWPVIPILSEKAKNILHAAITEYDLNPHNFSKVGDCQFTSDTFLAGYVKGIYLVPEGLNETTHFFEESMVRDSVTATIGLGINSVLNPMFGRSVGNIQCETNETPLNCELRTRKPSVVLIAMGTNWKPHMELTFEENLRQVVEIILDSGALPVLATKADNIETDWKLNLAIARVAYDYDLPMVNIWRYVQPLPNHGLSLKDNKYLSPDGWMARNDAWLKMLDELRQEEIQKK